MNRSGKMFGNAIPDVFYVQVFCSIAAANLANSNRAVMSCSPLRINSTSVSGTAGSAVDVVGNITNNTGALVFLNGDSFSLADTSISLDDSDFFENAPFTPDSGASSGSFDIFVIQTGASAAPGILTPNFFSVLGGSDSGSSDVLGTVTFDVDVQGRNTRPEPSGLLLLACGIAAILAIRRDR
jgi:hypothetical protein